ncbi:MAG: Ribosomal RNA small subunit methyltransferase E [Firmicutes bacterium ADurb.Bin182]|nr:MAG: Ribosomal RNA small subunit methyltransferase E [Firmicutes bacterium ADurb.Bin182]
MHRFFVDRNNIDYSKRTAFIEGEDAKHISRVLRLRENDNVVLCDGCESEYTAAIFKINQRRVDLRLSDEKKTETEPGLRITLYQCLPKAGKMELIIQKCVELGVYEIVPVISNRCVVKVSDDDVRGRVGRWQRVALEAAKQSGRGIIPKVKEPVEIGRISAGRHALFLIADEEERSATLKSVLRANKGILDLGLLIGPEGGLERAEVSGIPGAFPFTLGRRILRTETAGMAVIAMILFETEG